MAEWYCFKDKVKMEPCDVLMHYIVERQYVRGIKCPKCGVQYINEETVLTIVQGAEAALESK
jgi:hypothetical protein